MKQCYDAVVVGAGPAGSARETPGEVLTTEDNPLIFKRVSVAAYQLLSLTPGEHPRA
jgi:hypothetical protein